MQSLLFWIGSPVWLSLLIAALMVVISLYVSLWSVIASLWAAFGALVACAFGGVVAGGYFVATGYGLPGVAIVAASLIGAGLSIFLFFGCREATKRMVQLTKCVIVGIKHYVTRKGEKCDA